MTNELCSIISNQLQPRQVNENHLPFNHPWFMFPSKKFCRLCTSPAIKIKKKSKKNHVFCHFGVLFQILIFCFSHKDYPGHYSGDFAHAIVTIIGKHPNKGLAGFW